MNQDENKKRNLIIAAVTAVGILVILLILLFSFSRYFTSKGNETATADGENTQETETTSQDFLNDSISGTIHVDVYDYLDAAETYYEQIYRFYQSSDLYSASEMVDIYTDEKKRIDQFLNNAVDVSRDNADSGATEKLKSILTTQSETCDQLIDYYQTGDQASLSKAITNIENTYYGILSIKDTLNVDGDTGNI